MQQRPSGVFTSSWGAHVPILWMALGADFNGAEF